MRRWLYYTIPAAILLALIFWRLAANNAAQAAQNRAALARKKAPPVVRVAPVVQRDIVHEFLGVADVQSPVTVQISAKVSDRIIYLRLRPGATVTKGQILAKLDPSEIQASIDQQTANVRSAEANLENARVRYKRYYSLYRQGFTAAQDVDDQKTQVLTAQAALNAASSAVQNLRAQLADLTLRSPINGFVTARYFDSGSVVGAGQAILTVQPLRHVFVSTSAPSMLAAQISRGMPATASFDSLPGRTFTGRVTHVDPAIDPVSREFLVQATFNNPGALIRPGMYGQLTVVTRVTRNALVVPHEALNNGPRGQTVTVVDARGTAHNVPVRTGDQDPQGVQVFGDVTPGENVVIMKAQPVRDGQTVRINEVGAPVPVVGQPEIISGQGVSATATAAPGSAGNAPTYGPTTGPGGTAAGGVTGGGSATTTAGATGTGTSSTVTTGGRSTGLTPQTYGPPPSAPSAPGAATAVPGTPGASGTAAGRGGIGGTAGAGTAGAPRSATGAPGSATGGR